MFYKRYFSTCSVNIWIKKKIQKKNYWTSIENDCVVEKQLSISFELFVTSVFPFVHFLQREKNQNGQWLILKTLAINLTVWECGKQQDFPEWHYNCPCVYCSCVHTDRMFIQETHNSVYSQGIPGRWSAEGPTSSATLLLQHEHLICNNDKSCGYVLYIMKALVVGLMRPNYLSTM